MNFVFKTFFAISILACQEVSAGQLKVEVTMWGPHGSTLTSECDLVSADDKTGKFGGALRRVKYDELAGQLQGQDLTQGLLFKGGEVVADPEKYSYAKLARYFEILTPVGANVVWVNKCVGENRILIPFDVVTIGGKNYGQFTSGTGLVFPGNVEAMRLIRFQSDSGSLEIKKDPLIYVAFSKKSFKDNEN